jgi:protocatechuate 3,4-dioxygenase beta subunit
MFGRALIIGVLVFGLAACSGTNTSDSTATLQDVDVTPAILAEGETAIVEVLVTNANGDPLANATVYLYAEPNTAGVFSSSVVETNGDGIATAIFTATVEGSVTISARVEGDQTTLTKDIVIEDGTGGGNQEGHIILTITPALVQADGYSTATVNALVSDGQGNPVSDGSVIKFVAGEKFMDVNGDGIWTNNVDTLIFDLDSDGLWDPIGSIDATVTTNGGQATTTYVAGSTAGVVYIKATGGQPGEHYSAEVSLSLTSDDSVHSIVLTPSWQNVQVRGTGGVEFAHLLAETFDAKGNPAPQGREVEFLITAGPGGGEAINGDPVGPVGAITDANGVASVTLNAGSASGTVRVLARCGSVVSAATHLTIRSGPPAFISLGVSDCNVPSWEVVNSINDVVAVVVDQWGNEVPDSTSIWFGCEQGLIEGADVSSPTVTLRGTARSTWHSGAPKNDGYVVYWAQTAGGDVVDTSAFIESGPAAYGQFLAWPDTLLADNKDKGEVVIDVRDGNGVFVDDGYIVEVEADIGLISDGQAHDGCHSSIYVGDYVAGVLDVDYHVTIPDDGIGAIATITARSGGFFGFNGSVTVVLRTGTAYSKTSIVDVPSSMVFGTSAPIEIQVKDRWGNPLGGHLVDVSCNSGGTVTGSPQYSNEYGVAGGFEFIATNNQSFTEALIVVRDLDPNYGGMTINKKVSLEE